MRLRGFGALLVVAGLARLVAADECAKDCRHECWCKVADRDEEGCCPPKPAPRPPAAPKLLAPADGATAVRGDLLRVSLPDGVDACRVEICADAACAQVRVVKEYAAVDPGTRVVALTFETTYPTGTWYWRARNLVD